MGTSKRNLSQKVRNLLQDINQEDLNDKAPQIVKTVLTKKILDENIGSEKVIINTINIVKNKFNSLTIGGFKGKSKKELSIDPMSRTEFIDMILEQIETEEIINSTILSKSLNIVLTKMLMRSSNEEFDVYSFAQLLFYEIVKQLLVGQLTDNIKDKFKNMEYGNIESMIASATNKIINESVYAHINKFVDRKIGLNEVLNNIVAQTSNVKFGEF